MKRRREDIYFNTLMWIADGRRRWNRKARKKPAERSLRLEVDRSPARGKVKGVAFR